MEKKTRATITYLVFVIILAFFWTYGIGTAPGPDYYFVPNHKALDDSITPAAGADWENFQCSNKGQDSLIFLVRITRYGDRFTASCLAGPLFEQADEFVANFSEIYTGCNGETAKRIHETVTQGRRPFGGLFGPSLPDLTDHTFFVLGCVSEVNADSRHYTLYGTFDNKNNKLYY